MRQPGRPGAGAVPVYDAPVSGEVDARLRLRRGTPADTRVCHELLWESATDLGKRRGMPLEGTAADWWAGIEPVHRYLEHHAAEWWVAENDEGRLDGYARSIERGGLFELTELFVRPGAQSRGVGRELVSRAFPVGRGDLRVIIATTDVRALARYHAAGVIARFPMFTFVGEPSPAAPGEMVTSRVERDAADLELIRGIEKLVLGHARSTAELEWMLEFREGYLYRRGPRTVAFSFISADGSGPIMAGDPADLAEVLLHVESRAHELGVAKLELEVPSVNATAVGHLSSRGFRIDPWMNLLMSNRPFGQFDRYVGFNPPIFL